MSPTIRAVPRIVPSTRRDCDGREGGTTSATGLPKRVMSTGRRVRRTRSSTARQVALNLEMAICLMSPSCHYPPAFAFSRSA